MKKSVYSVVLSDDIIAEVDRLAYIKNTNRSNMINQILAEYVSLTTPEKRINDIFEELSSLLFAGETFKLLSPPSPSVISLRSALSYKYNPTVKYAVELYRERDGRDGEIRVSMRTQNALLISEMINFYSLWVGTERAFGFTGAAEYRDGVFHREMILRKSPYFAGKKSATARSFADIIANYISLFDKAMKLYFSDTENAEKLISRMYLSYISGENEVI